MIIVPQDISRELTKEWYTDEDKVAKRKGLKHNSNGIN